LVYTCQRRIGIDTRCVERVRPSMDSLRAYNHLESAILTGKLKPRERLVETDLAERLKMSRTPIREALRRLEDRGMVRILPRRGAVVLDLSPSEVENIYAVRGHLEMLAARLAAQRISRLALAQVAGMEAAHAKLVDGRDVRALMLANDRFHDAIYAVAENPCLVELIQQLRRQVHVVRFNAWALPERIAQSLAEHRRMVESLEVRDGDGLAELIQAHIQVAKDIYLSYVDTRPGSPTAAAEDAMAAVFGGERGTVPKPKQSRWGMTRHGSDS
jgi:DNA-binding GntR family transcriptional regulator